MLDSVVSMRGRTDQQAAVGALVEHVHAELLSSLKADILRREKLDETSEVQLAKSIEPLLATRPGLLRDGTYHLDTTHLASTVRFARILDNEEQLRMAVDLAQYGRQLHTQYQYASEEPFAELYPMSLAMFRALLGEHVEAALKMFLQKAESLDPQEHGTVAIENYADLLTRVGRPAEAMQFLIKKMPRGMRPFGIAPSLIELAELSKDYAPMLQQAKERGDLVGFAAALLQSATSTRK
jgi:ParB-like chromosome segregation protein Spo0J